MKQNLNHVKNVFTRTPVVICNLTKILTNNDGKLTEIPTNDVKCCRWCIRANLMLTLIHIGTQGRNQHHCPIVIGKFAVPDFRKIHYPEMVKFRYHF